MANVYFKRGHQSSLDTLINNVNNSVPGAAFVEGSFYLTDDTNRLYFAQSSTNLVDLNQYIHFVANYDALPSAASTDLKDGDMYYLQTENILCVYQANKSQPWVQVNPDTKLKSSQNAVVVSEPNGTTDTADVGFVVQDTTNTTAAGGFQIVGGNHVYVDVQGNVITLSADDENDNTTYTLGTSDNATKGVVSLNPDTGTGSTIDIVGDGTNVFVTSNDNGQISISGSSGITGIADGFDSNGQYGITLTRTSGGNLNSQGITPTVEYGKTGGKRTATFASVNGATPTAALDVYTITQVDGLINDLRDGLNAMKYAGTVTQSDASTKIVLQALYGIGTVWKAAEDITISTPQNLTAKTGDLIIAGGTSDTAVVWEVVPSGDDQFLSLVGDTATNRITFSDSANNKTNSDIGTIVISGGRKAGADAAATAANTAIDVSTAVTSQSGSHGDIIEFTVVHGDPGTGTAVTVPAASGTAIQTTGTTLSIPVITGISKDAQGHITNVSAQTYELKDTHAQLQPITTTVDSTGTNNASVGFGFQLDAGTTVRQCGFAINSSTLSFTANDSTDTITVNLEWGTF